MNALAQIGVRNSDKSAFHRQPHIGPQTYIGVMFAVLCANWCKIPTRCANSSLGLGVSLIAAAATIVLIYIHSIAHRLGKLTPAAG
tara:strand:+ start:648 stop:905 length:258 start_codon:yes stop_codon:yes gene_type:complete